VNASWGRHDEPEAAVDRILSAAQDLYMSAGFTATTMAHVAERAGCSRATLYNYFPNKHELRTALRNRAAIEIAAETSRKVEAIRDPVARVTEAIVLSIRQVRASPALSMWFTAENLGPTNELAGSSDVIAAIAAGFTGELNGTDPQRAGRRARMMVRIILSFLSTPGADEADERRMIEEFIAPAFVNVSPTGR
jgi:AcrR family transcriptional regulator